MGLERVDTKPVECISSVGVVVGVGLGHAGMGKLKVSEKLLDGMLLWGGKARIPRWAVETGVVLWSSSSSRLSTWKVSVNSVWLVSVSIRTAMGAKIESLGRHGSVTVDSITLSMKTLRRSRCGGAEVVDFCFEVGSTVGDSMHKAAGTLLVDCRWSSGDVGLGILQAFLAVPILWTRFGSTGADTLAVLMETTFGTWKVLEGPARRL